MDNIRTNSTHIIIDEDPLSTKKCLLHSSAQSADLAPVHTSAKYSVRMGEPERKLQSVDSETLANTMSSSLQEKLNISSKTKNCNKNGVNLRLGTTDVEVHCGPPSENDVNALQGKSDLKINISQAKLNNVSSQENTSSYNIGLYSDGRPNKSNADYSSRPTVNNFKPDSSEPSVINSANGVMCNGHTVSEATSSNSLAISDFSLSSDKSTSLDSSYSCPGARPRTRNTSNSSSQSTQPQSESEADLSSTSDSCKVISLEPNSSLVPIPASPCIPVKELPVEYVNYENEHQMEAIMRLIQKDLSEPYSIYTYRYFIHNWPKLCFLAMIDGEIIGAIVCKLDLHKKVTVRGYIAMLAVDHRYRKRRIGSNLVQRAIREMAADDADEVVLETEITNKSALKLYENLGFVRDKRLFRYYLNGVDALRLKLWLS